MMGIKFALSVAAVLLVLACATEGRHIALRASHDEDYVDVQTDAGRRPHPSSLRSVSHNQARVFPGAVAIKKLVLLKFKKIVPISLILLKSSSENEAELVPVYPTSDIPADVQFIPTPNGISGHKDVQAIAIPSELHEQLQLNGLTNLENLEALLSEAQDEPEVAGNAIAVVQEAQAVDEPLNVKEEDEDQLLDIASVEKPAKTTTLSGLRRIATDEIVRPNVRNTNARHTSVEEIPLFLYSAKDSPQLVQSGRKYGRRQHA